MKLQGLINPNMLTVTQKGRFYFNDSHKILDSVSKLDSNILKNSVNEKKHHDKIELIQIIYAQRAIIEELEK